MKSSIVKQMSAVRVETVERIQQTSNVIAEATSDISEVTVEAQVSLPTYLVATCTGMRCCSFHDPINTVHKHIRKLYKNKKNKKQKQTTIIKVAENVADK